MCQKYWIFCYNVGLSKLKMHKNENLFSANPHPAESGGELTTLLETPSAWEGATPSPFLPRPLWHLSLVAFSAPPLRSSTRAAFGILISAPSSSSSSSSPAAAAAASSVYCTTNKNMAITSSSLTADTNKMNEWMNNSSAPSTPDLGPYSEPALGIWRPPPPNTTREALPPPLPSP